MHTINKAFVAFFLILSLTMLAQTNTPNIDQRHLNQEVCIQQGVKSGSLLPREAARLERG